MLAAYTHCIPKLFDKIWRNYYLSASSRGICRFYISHLLPVIRIGVSGGRYFYSSLTHVLTRDQDSKSVMSYTINAPKFNIWACFIYLQPPDSRPCWERDIALARPCPRYLVELSAPRQPRLSDWGNLHRRYLFACRQNCLCKILESGRSSPHGLNSISNR